MNIDSFRILIDLIYDNNKNKRFIHSLINVSYPDAFLEKRYSYNNKNQIELIIKNIPLGLFVIKKLIDRFHPWIKIYGQKKLIKPDFPEEFWKPSNEGGIGEKWSREMKKRIQNLNWKI